MDARIARLLSLIEDAEALLRQVGEVHWADWLAGDAVLIRNLDLRGIEHLLGGYGGMGSFSDVLVSPSNGHVVNRDDAVEVNARLSFLRSEIYDLAETLRRAEYRASRGA